MRAASRALACLVLTIAATACTGPPPDFEAISREAVVALRRGDRERALAVTEEGARRARRLDGGAPWAARFDLLRAEVLLAGGGSDDLDGADRLIAEAYEASRADPTIRARWMYLRAYAAYKRAEYTDAVSTLEAAVRAASEGSAADVAIDAYNLLGSSLLRIQRLDEAERSWEEASRLADGIGDRFRSAAALLNLGTTRIQSYRFDEAITRLDRARTLASEEGADLLQAAAVGNLSLCWQEIGDLDRALEARLEAIEVQRRAGADLWVCQSLGELGNLRRVRGEVADAIDNLSEAVALARSLKVPAETALWSAGLARALIAAGRASEAPEWIEAARSGFRESGNALGLAMADLVEGDLATALGDEAKARQSYEAVSAAVPDVPELVWQAQNGVANALRRAGRPFEARERFEAAIAAIAQGRERLFRTESRLAYLSEPIVVYQDYVDLLLELGRADEALAVIEASRARTLLESRGGSVGDPVSVRRLVRAARENDAVFLSYWISPRGSFAWIFSGDGAHRVPLDDAGRLERLVGVHRAVIEQGWRDPLESGNEAARELYARLAAPLRAHIPDNARVIVVPDGPLHALNLETLVVEDPRPHYLIEDLEIEIAPALAPMLADGAKPSAGSRGLLLVGDPETSDPAFPRLPHAARELEAIAARLPGVRIDRLMGHEATSSAVLAAPLESYAWLHFAAHAQASRGNPLDSAVVLSDSPGGTKLYARDLVDRRLAADLVTLSACRSAGSRTFSGEGLVGLAWVFMRSGASRVIAGLWDVSDRSTVTIMETMYERLGRGASSAEALRAAKLDLMRAGPTTAKPYHWAPFQLYTRTPAP